MKTSTISERLNSESELYRKIMDKISVTLRCAAPGKIMEISRTDGVPTVKVQLSLMEKLIINGEVLFKEITPLLDVPLFIHEGGGYLITFPVNVGDECLVVFGDNCIDSWWKSGGVQKTIYPRRHSLSDGFAIVGFRNQTRPITNLSTDSVQVRNTSGDTLVEVKDGEININSSNTVNITNQGDVNITNKGDVNVNTDGAVDVKSASASIDAPTIDVNGSAAITIAGGSVSITGSAITLAGSSSLAISGSADVLIQGHSFLHHHHIRTKPGSASEVSGEVE
jgi:hypothetical protein